MAHGIITGQKRGKAKCPYPNGYASPQDVKSNPAAYQFNCAQRAHAQFIENAPQTIISMLVSGLLYPNATAILGLGWFISRVLYLYGYVWGRKAMGAGRYLGTPFWAFQIALMVLAGRTAWDLCK